MGSGSLVVLKVNLKGARHPYVPKDNPLERTIGLGEQSSLWNFTQQGELMDFFKKGHIIDLGRLQG